MDPSLEKLKDHDLLDYAKKLGIKNFGEYSGFVSVQLIMKIIYQIYSFIFILNSRQEPLL